MYVEGFTSQQFSQSPTCPDFYHTTCSRGVVYVCVLPAHRPDCLGMLLDEQHPNRLLRFCCRDSASRFCAAQNHKERARVARTLAAEAQGTVPFHPTRQAPSARRQTPDCCAPRRKQKEEVA